MTPQIYLKVRVFATWPRLRQGEMAFDDQPEIVSSRDLLPEKLCVDGFGLVDAAGESVCMDNFDAPEETEASFGE
jgi:hypothetical protein